MLRTWAVVGVALLLVGCGRRVYLDSWQPERLEHQQGLPRTLTEALVMRAIDLPHLQAAGGEFVGHHEARSGWARRVASTGGTHFVGVEDRAAITRTPCVTYGAVEVCESRSRRRYSRVAVFRVPEQRWHELPVHLIPPLSVVLNGVRASAYRDDCRVHNTWGTTSCSRRVRVVLRTARDARGGRRP